ncbi:MAG TPA: phosphatidylserine decarboxylase [Planctomycetota bacterium]|nr:phosphatidylserine decarboxylase [Planctomycetota bacterium]
MSTHFHQKERGGVASPAPSPHPELSRMEGRYIVPWGRREVACVLGSATVLTLGIVILAVLHAAIWALLLLPVLLLAAFLVLFFRNPRRAVPLGPGLLVSPADGTVQDIVRVEEAEFLAEPAIRIGIFLSIFDVHVNRAPARGRVEWVRHQDGLHRDARNPRAGCENESNAIGILRDDEGGPGGLRLLVKQISGAIARRIICPLAPGDRVERGALMGMIKYGSRTELYVPVSSGAEVQIETGQKVQGGVTILARWPAAGP